jgi:hypothetical protein
MRRISGIPIRLAARNRIMENNGHGDICSLAQQTDYTLASAEKQLFPYTFLSPLYISEINYPRKKGGLPTRCYSDQQHAWCHISRLACVVSPLLRRKNQELCSTSSEDKSRVHRSMQRLGLCSHFEKNIIRR